MSTKIPERVRWGVEQLAAAPDEEILEIGCGTGVAVGLVCAQLGNGRLIAIDRSVSMVTQARARNEACIRAGKAEILCTGLLDLSGPPSRFDKAFAINVNLFWLRPQPELAVLQRVLKPGGTIHLIFQPPGESKVDAIAKACQSHLAANGFTQVRCLRSKISPVSAICIQGVLAPC